MAKKDNIQKKKKGIHKPNISKRFIVYMICVSIATILWLMTKLNKEYTTTFSYPVVYRNLPKNKINVSNTPKKLTFEVQANGFVLIGKLISTSFQPIRIDINDYIKKTNIKTKEGKIQINTNIIKEKINNQIGNNVKITQILPEIIDFNFVSSIPKKVAVIADIKYSIKKQHIQTKPLMISPDSIEINGPKNIMDTITKVYTKNILLGEIYDNKEIKLELVHIENIIFDKEDVKVSISIEQSTEVKKKFDIKIKNLPDSLNMKLFPNTVEVTYETGLSMYKSNIDTNFIFYVDFNDTKNNNKLPILTKNIPNGIYKKTLNCNSVDYIIESRR